MNLLFDQNISYRILKKLEKEFPNSLHISRIGLKVPAKDKEIWEYAQKNQIPIVTFDEDFVELLTLYGAPPKVIWLRFGNQQTEVIVEKLKRHYLDVEELY